MIFESYFRNLAVQTRIKNFGRTLISIRAMTPGCHQSNASDTGDIDEIEVCSPQDQDGVSVRTPQSVM